MNKMFDVTKKLPETNEPGAEEPTRRVFVDVILEDGTKCDRIEFRRRHQEPGGVFTRFPKQWWYSGHDFGTSHDNWQTFGNPKHYADVTEGSRVKFWKYSDVQEPDDTINPPADKSEDSPRRSLFRKLTEPDSGLEDDTTRNPLLAMLRTMAEMQAETKQPTTCTDTMDELAEPSDSTRVFQDDAGSELVIDVTPTNEIVFGTRPIGGNFPTPMHIVILKKADVEAVIIHLQNLVR